MRETALQTKRLSERLKRLMSSLDLLAEDGGPFGALIDGIVGELRRINDERLTDMHTFNIVLFGKTGAGKSCMIEALTYGDGGTASLKGDSDHTKEVSHREWGAVRVYDTPGFGGLDPDIIRTQMDAARRAAASADVVVLCFDDSNQRFAEFQTIAKWIGEYQKVAVAVLNVKNQRWRWDEPGVANLDAQVAGHARHVREELARIGLGRTPIIALHALNAVFARALRDCPDPQPEYRGPQPELRSIYLNLFGMGGLEELSNIKALDSLLTEVIRQGGAGLRLGSVHRFVTAAVGQASARLKAAAREAQHLAEAHELGIAYNLDILGRPAPDTFAYKMLLSAIAALEELRGEPFVIPHVSQAVAFGQDLLVGRLGRLQHEADVRARHFIHDAIAAQRVPPEGAFEEHVFAHDAMENAAEQALRDYHLFLDRNFDLVVRDVYRKFREIKAPQVKIHAGKGKWLFRAAIGSSVLSIGTSGAVIFAGFVAANIWNPFGWGAAGVAFLAVTAGILLEGGGILGRRRAEQQRERALADALAQAAASVRTTFARLADQLELEFTRLRRTVLMEGLSGPLTEAIEQRGLRNRYLAANTLLADILCLTPPAQHNPELLLAASVQGCAPDGIRDGLWLGARRRRAGGKIPRQGLHNRPDVREAMRAFRSNFPKPITTGAARRWTAEVRASLGDGELVRELDRLAKRDGPTIVFCGDYDSGKSSLIKRLLGEDVEVAVSPVPETAKVTQYRHSDGWVAVDTPGFQANGAETDRETIMEVAGGSLIVLVFTPGLVSCDPADLLRVLHGDAGKNVPGRIRHCLFVVNRADSFGTDPQYDPSGFAVLLARKLEQIRRDVPGLGHGVCLAAAPFGLFETQSWDGLHEFGAGLSALQDRLRADHAEVAVLTGGQILLGERLSVLLREESELAIRVEIARSAHRNVARLVYESSALLHERKEDLRRRVGRIIDDILSEALATKSEKRRNALVKRLMDLGDDPQFRQLIREWSEETAARVKAFLELCVHQMTVGFEVPVPREDFPDLDGFSDARVFGKGDVDPATHAANWTGKAGAALARLNKFASGGGKLVKAIRMAGPAATVIGGVISAHLLIKELRSGAQNDEARRKALHKLHAHGDAWAQQVLDTDETLKALRRLRSDLSKSAQERATELAGLEDRAKTLAAQAATCTTFVDRFSV
ncbi:hypothetical protein GCM10009556_064680 [Acrocarpospora pleiomorpha]|uniref:GTPase n=1 Tax=Acrocarpospora pleiomorpha TaxID=90975 RepID=UPI0031DD8C9B